MTTTREWSEKSGGYIEVETLTAGEARALITKERRKNGHRPVARVNKAFSKQDALDILEKSLGQKRDDEPIRQVIANNILRECGKKRLVR